MDHSLIKRQIIKLSYDICKIEMGKRILLKISREFELYFSYIFCPAIAHLIICFNQ